MHEWIEEITITELQAKMASGELSALELVDIYLERVEALDTSGPMLNAVIEINPDARETATQLDDERGAGKVRGPLHGIPMMLKDNFDTADQMQTTAGSLALEGSYSTQDATAAAKLRQAGAVFLGKTNLSEWANFRSTHSISGWSSRGGQTRNPYALDRNASGSSSGSAVAVSANLCAAALGTETDGSIISPAQANGIVGLKPTVGLISRAGIIPVSHSQDTAGVMARCVSEVATLLGALTGADARDPATQASASQAHSDYAPFLNRDGLKGARIGVARNYFGFNPQVDAVMEDCIHLMKDLGAEIVDHANLTHEGGEPVEDDAILADEGPMGEVEYEVLLYEFKHDLNAYLAALAPGGPVRSLEDVIRFNEQNKEAVMPYFGQERMIKAQEKGPLTEAAYLQALETSKRLSGEQGIDALLATHKLDAIVAPSGGPAWLIDPVNGDHYSGGSSSLAAAAGYPSLTVPAGFIFGLPVGISFFSGAFQEPTLLSVAYAFEQASNVRRKPDYLEKVQFTTRQKPA